ncbi:MAG TPA: ATPase domain-containing protein [Longimicrobiales bacterium]|nr:ATPase domain-containing protein [Longimicrobiales bacterium]
MSTGHRELDAILGGGFPEHSTNILMGPPGTGKTILAEQTMFHNAGGERPAVYISTLSEPLAKVLGHLQRFRFFDAEKMLGGVVYEDLAGALLERGVGHLVERVRELMREVEPKLLVIDSFKAVHDLAGTPLEMRRVAAELGGLLSASDVTTFLVGEYAPEAVSEYPEFAVVDGIVELSRQRTDKRDERHIRVLKLRGSGYQEGLHAFTITPDGLRVYPRLVSPAEPLPYTASAERVPTGVAGLDAMLGGGFWRGSATLVVGPAGSGKTTFALAFALGAVERGEAALYLNFQENPTQLARTIGGLGVDLEEYRRKGLRLQYASPVELRIDAVVVELFRSIREEGIRHVVVDAVGDLALAATSRERFHDYMYSVVQHFAGAEVTSVMTLEGQAGVRRAWTQPESRYSTLSDVLIELDLLAGDPPVGRTLRVVKARGIAHPLAPRAMEIGAKGIRVAEGAQGDASRA